MSENRSRGECLLEKVENIIIEEVEHSEARRRKDILMYSKYSTNLE